MKIYLASSIGPVGSKIRLNAEEIAQILEVQGHEVYIPWKHRVPHPWDYPNNEWALMTFMNDIRAMDEAEIMVMLSYGRESTAGANWEAGYFFGTGKKVIVVEITDQIMSLMVANGRYATVKGIQGIVEYDWEKMPMSRTDTEQK